MSNTHKNNNSNDERTVRCPVEGCEKEVLSRGLHLHVLRKNDEGHGPQGDIPPDVNLEDAETVGSRSVSVDYPKNRKTEQVARQCPYCSQVFRGKQGLAIHFGQVVGRKNHPADEDEFPDPEECPAVHLDENQNIVEVVEEGSANIMPSTRQRREKKDSEEIISELREKVDDEEFIRRVEKQLQ